jgi:hypothetical protein
MRFELLSAVLGLVAVLAAFSGSGRADSRAGDGVRINQLQVIGTHNSYHRETSEAEQMPTTR